MVPVGWIVALFAWGLRIEALALAPLSIVQAILSGGLVFLAVLAERCREGPLAIEVLRMREQQTV